MRIFFDTNVLTSALAFPNGLCARLLQTAFEHHDVEVTEYVLRELDRTLVRKLYRSQHEVDGWLRELREYVEILPEVPPIDIDIRDPKDLPILSAAVAADVDVLVTGDKDFLELPNPPIRILSPRALHDMIVSKK